MRLFQTTSAPRLLLPLALTTAPFFSLCAAQNRPADLNQVLSSKPELSIFWSLVQNNTDYLFQLPTVGGVTVIAPNNDSFARIQNFDPKNTTKVNALLEYHTLLGTYLTSTLAEGATVYATSKLTDRRATNVTAGQSVLLNKERGGNVIVTSGAGSRSTLVDPDLVFSGGVVHVADALLTAPQRLETTGLTAYKDLTAFVSALYAADLIPQFADSADVTIFAPQNAAFQLLAGTLTALDRASLARVMSYHLVPGKVLPASSLTNGSRLTTAADGARAMLGVYRSGNNMWLGNAKVLQPDVLIANGVVHIVDSVLNPDTSPGYVPNPEIDLQPPAFAVSGTMTSTGARAPTPFTSALPCSVSCPVSSTSTTESSTRTTSSAGVRTTSSQGGGAGAGGPRCTGAVVAVAAAVAAGVGGMYGVV